MAPRRSLFLLVSCLALFSCGDGGGTSGVKLEELPAFLADHLCTEVEGCFDQRTLDSLFGAAGCNGRLLAQIEDTDFALTTDAVNSGRVRYDPSHVDACLASIKGVGCAFGTTRVLQKSDCDAVFVGKQKRGADCEVDADCEGTSFCKRAPDSCPGTCSALLGPGESCQKDSQCQDGLSCAQKDRTCTAPAAVGDACGGGVAGNCAAGLACVGEQQDKGIAGVCTATSQVYTQKLGDSCDIMSGQLCKEGVSCVVRLMSGKTSSMCEKPSDADSTCNFGVPSACPEDQYCDADISTGTLTGACVTLPAAGENCATIPGSPSCAAGLECDTDLRCHPVNRLGQPCMSDDGCASGYCVAAKCQRVKGCNIK